MKHRLTWPLAFALTAVSGLASAQEIFSYDQGSNELPASLFTNYIQMVDLDGDGDLDIIAPNCSGFMGTGPQALEVYRNDGSASFTDYGFPLGGTKPIRQVALGDIDGDGDIDVYVPDAAAGPHLLYVNDGNGGFTEEASTRLPGGFSPRTGATELADVDNDGDLDLFVGDAYLGFQSGPIQGHLLFNDGSGVFTEGAAMPTGPGEDPIDVDFADIDRDWDLDIILNMHDGKSLAWVNDGAGNFSDATSLLHAMEGFHYGPSLCDVDGDTDLDMWTDNAGPGLADILAINDGNGTLTDMTGSLVTANPAADDNGVICVDIDQDGDFDAAIPSLSGRDRVLINDGSGAFLYVENQFPSESNDASLWLDFGDLNGDGRLDAVTGQGEPSDNNRVFIGNTNMPVDTQAPRIITVEEVSALDASDTPVVRYAVSDAVVTDTGPRLSQAFVRVETNTMTEVDAVFMGGDLFRAELPAFADGTMVTYAACAVDRQGNEGCGTAVTYTVGEPVGTGGGGAGGDGTGAGGDAGSGGGSASGGSASGGSGADVDDNGGCGCSLPGENDERNGALLLILAGAAITMRRRRR